MSEIKPLIEAGYREKNGICPYCGQVISLDMVSLKRHAKFHGIPDEAWLS